MNKIELATTEELLEEVGKRCESFVFSAVLKEIQKKNEIVTLIDSAGNYYERLGMCADLQHQISAEALKEED